MPGQPRQNQPTRQQPRTNYAKLVDPKDDPNFVLKYGYNPNISQETQPNYPYSYWEEPKRVARIYNALQSMPQEWEPPAWLDRGAVEAAYEYFKKQNNGGEWWTWKRLPESDPGREFLRSLPVPPDAYRLAEDNRDPFKPVTEVYERPAYQPTPPDQLPNVDMMGMTDQQLADMPAWKRNMLAAMQNPQLMGGVTGAVAGIEGGPMGMAFGGALGQGLGKLAGTPELDAQGKPVIDPETGQPKLKYAKVAEGMMLLDQGAEAAERTLGFIAQLGASIFNPEEYGTLGEFIQNADDAWRAGHVFYDAGGLRSFDPLQLIAKVQAGEPLTFQDFLMGQHFDPLNVLESAEAISTGRAPHLLKPGQVWGFEGSEPVTPEVGTGLAAVVEARRMLADPRMTTQQVYDYMTQQMGLSGFVRENLGHLIIDPLNFVGIGLVEGALSPIAKTMGNTNLLKAIDVTRGESASYGPVRVTQNYRTILRSLPSEELSKMGAVTRFIAGVDEAGQNLPPLASRIPQVISKVGGAVVMGGPAALIGAGLGPIGAVVGGVAGAFIGWKQGLRYLASMTPASKAHEMMNEGILEAMKVADKLGDDPITLADGFLKLADTPQEFAESISMASVNSPAASGLRRFLVDNREVVVQAKENWQISRGPAKIVQMLSQATGKTTDQVLQELGTTKQADVLLRQYINAARQRVGEMPELAVMIRAYDDALAPTHQLPKEQWLTAKKIQDITKLFTGEHALPLTEEEFKGHFFGIMGDALNEWSAEWFGVKPEPAWVRLGATMKAAQSLVLLGLNPAYLINNVINNMVTQAAGGVFGLRGGKQIAEIWKRLGIEPPRLRAGYGPAASGIDYSNAGIRKALDQPGTLTNLTRGFQRISEKLGIFTQASMKMEQWASAQAYTSGMLQALARLKRRGKGFRTLPPDLEAGLRAIHPQAPELIYRAIEAGMNQREIEAALWDGLGRYTVESGLSDALANLETRGVKIDPEDAAEFLHTTGIVDELNEALKTAKTPEQRRDAVAKCDDKVQDYLDRLNANALRAYVEGAAATTKVEQFEGVLKIWDNQQLDIYKMAHQNSVDWQNTWTAVRRYDKDPVIKAEVIRAQKLASQKAYQRFWLRMQANVKGIMDGLGLDSTSANKINTWVVELTDNWGEFFKLRDDLHDKFFNTEYATRDLRDAAWNAMQDELEALYQKHSFKEINLQAEMDKTFTEGIRQKYGAERGALAEKWRADMLSLRKEILGRMQRHRQEMRLLYAEERDVAWKEFWEKELLPLIAQKSQLEREGAYDLAGKPRPPEEPAPGPEGTPPEGTPPAAEEPVIKVATAKVDRGRVQELVDQGMSQQDAIGQALKEQQEKGAQPQAARAEPEAPKETPLDVANEFKIPLATKTGAFYDQQAMNIVRKYGGDTIKAKYPVGTKLRDVDPADARVAFQAWSDAHSKYQLLKTLPEGKQTTALGVDAQTTYNFRYRLVEMADLVTSHTDSFEINDLYPQELQPRQRERAASQQQVDRIAMTLNPDALLVDTHRLDSGAMIIGPDMVVESGNGRMLALRRASTAYPQRYQDYTEALKTHLAEFGFTEEQLAGYKQPVLVRERMTDIDRVAFAAEANQATSARMSGVEIALQDAGLITDAIYGRLEIGEGQTVKEIVYNKNNFDLVRQLFSKLPDTERAALVDADGMLNQAGIERLSNALFIKTFPGDAGLRLFALLTETADANVKLVKDALYGSLTDLLRVEKLAQSGQRDRGLSIAGDLAEAMDTLLRLRQRGMTVEDYLANPSFITPLPTPFQQTLIRFLQENGRSPNRIKEAVRRYAGLVEQQPLPGQASLFGGEATLPRETLWTTATEKLTGKAQAIAMKPETQAAPGAPDMKVLEYEQRIRDLEAEAAKERAARQAEAEAKKKAEAERDAEKAKNGIDELTGLKKYAKGKGAYDAEIDQAPMKTVVDLAGLKWLNDAFGHEVGNEFIFAIVEGAKQTGIELYRMGGDEFIFPSQDAAGAKSLVDQLRKFLSETIIVVEGKDGTRRTVTGFSIHAGSGADFRAADEAANLDVEPGYQRGQQPPSLKMGDVERGGSEGAGGPDTGLTPARSDEPPAEPVRIPELEDEPTPEEIRQAEEAPLREVVQQQEKLADRSEEIEAQITLASDQPGVPLLRMGDIRHILNQEAQRIFKVSPLEANAWIAILDARAKVWAKRNGRAAYEWYASRFAGMVQGGIKDPSPTAKAAISYLEDNRAILHALNAPDVSSLVHEVAHIFRKDLEGADLRTAEEWAGVVNGKWTSQQEDYFARAFMRYLANGQAPTPFLAGAFANFKQWLLRIYTSLKGTWLDVNITPELKDVFDRLLSEEAVKPPVEFGKKPAPKTPPAPTQMGMFGAGEDLPMFSGTAAKAADETFTAEPVPPQQGVMPGMEELMRPQMEGAKPGGETPPARLGDLFKDRSSVIPTRIEQLQAKLKGLEEQLSSLTHAEPSVTKKIRDEIQQVQNQILDIQRQQTPSLEQAAGGGSPDAIFQGFVNRIETVLPGRKMSPGVEIGINEVREAFFGRIPEAFRVKAERVLNDFQDGYWRYKWGKDATGKPYSKEYLDNLKQHLIGNLNTLDEMARGSYGKQPRVESQQVADLKANIKSLEETFELMKQNGAPFDVKDKIETSIRDHKLALARLYEEENRIAKLPPDQLEILAKLDQAIERMQSQRAEARRSGSFETWREGINNLRDKRNRLIAGERMATQDITGEAVAGMGAMIRNVNLPEGRNDITTPDQAAQIGRETAETFRREQAPAEPSREEQLLHYLVGAFRNPASTPYVHRVEFERMLRERGYNLDNEADLNLAYDTLEGAFNLIARELRADLDQRNAPLSERLHQLANLEAQLTQARRTVTKTQLQQFSTPLTISEAAGYAADVRAGDVVGEPTAGTANLVDRFSQRQDVKVVTNEIDAGRRQVLGMIGYSPSDLDVMGSAWVLDPSTGTRRAPWSNVMIINPPWGAYSTGKYGKAIHEPVKLNDWSQRFTNLIMKRLPEGGRLVGVMPTNWVYTMDRSTRAITPNRSAYLKYLEENYTVRAIIESPPDAYKQRATGVSSLIIVIDKESPRGKVSTLEAWGANAPKSWEEYAKLIEQIQPRSMESVTHGQKAINQVPTAETTGPRATGLVDPAAARGEPRGEPAAIGRSAPGDVDRTAGGGAGQPGAGDATLQPGEPGRQTPDVAQPRREEGSAGAALVEGEPRDVSSPAERPAYSDAFRQRLDAGKQAVTHSRSFTEYVGRAPLGSEDVSHPHPSIVVETKSLAGVPYPPLEAEYRPSPGVMRAMNRRVLSLEGNLDPIWAAIQQNDKYRSGILIADDVGMGKSRTAAGFVIDRIQKGKKRILVVTKGRQNVENLMNSEFPGVWNGRADENGAFTFIPDDFPARRLFVTGETMPKVKKGEEAIPTFDEPTVYFMTHTEFKDFRDQIARLSVDTVVIDEVHEFKNVGQTQRGSVWYDLHHEWLSRGDVDFLYLSATPGTDISELQYLYGLKVWTIDGFSDWVQVVTGKISPEKAQQRITAEAKITQWTDALKAARREINPQLTTKKIFSWKPPQKGWQVTPDLFVYRSDDYRYRGEYVISNEEYGIIGSTPSETESVIIASMMADVSQSAYIQAKSDFNTRYPKPEKQDLEAVEIKDASDIVVKSERGQWGKKSGVGAFDTTLSPAHTEQIMRELKVGGFYLSRDISRAGVEFNVKEYTPPQKDIDAFNARVDIYRQINEAWQKYGKMNEGPKKAAALYGIAGDVQADAKRTLFNMRLPGVIQEADAALKRGEQVVISVVSVGEVDAETGFLRSALGKINTHEVRKIGDGEYSDPTEIPEALVTIAELREAIAALPAMASPIDILRDYYGDRIDFVTGATSVKDRVRATREFQNNQLDVIVISGAGKTGINLHDVTGKKKVHLIVADYEWSATTFKQELGRVDRTGQKSNPAVTVMHTGSAGERKFVATISNRMKGLGALSKGGAESTGTGALTDTFELGSTLDKLALDETWRDLDRKQRALFLDKYFRDPTTPEIPKSHLEATSESLKKFLLALQSMYIKDANDILDIYMAKREALMGTEAATADEAAKTARSTGEVIRQVQLADNLRLTQVKNQEGETFGILDGVLTPHMNRVRNQVVATGQGYSVLTEYSNNAWMRWVQFYDPTKNEYITGLRIQPTKLKAVAETFGQKMGTRHTPESALADLRGGDKIVVVGENMAEWELYLGKFGAREGKIVVDGAKMKNKDALLRNGASYNAVGNFFYVPEEKLSDFFRRFKIQTDEAAPQPGEWFDTDTGPKRILYQDEFGSPFYQDTGMRSPEEAPAVRYQDADGEVREVQDTGAPVDPIGQPGGASQLDPHPPLEKMLEDGYGLYQNLWKELREVMIKGDSKVPDGIKGLEGKLDNNQRAELHKQFGNIRKYMGEVYSDLADTKLLAVRMGEARRDMALLNYAKRYGFNQVLDFFMPYSFWYTWSGINWALRMIDNPSWLLAWAKIRSIQERTVNTPGFPTRLKHKIRIPMPYMPSWMGGGLYVDPLKQTFPFETFLRPFQQRADEQNRITQRAEYILAQQVEDGEIDEAEYQAAMNRQGTTWQNAYTQAEMEIEADTSNPIDFAGIMMGWSLPFQWGYKGLTGQADEINQLPATRLIQSLTAMAGANQGRGVNIEEPLRKALGLPMYGEFTAYQEDRMLSNLVAEGELTPTEAIRAMIDRSGPAFELAQRRAQNVRSIQFWGSPLGVDLFPEGEQEQRAYQQEYQRAIEAWKDGDESALQAFFEAYPEYEARSAINQEPEERLRKFLIGEIWNRWRELPDLHQQQLVEQLGDSFEYNFLGKETRSYDSLDTQTLGLWAQLMGVPPLETQADMPEVSLELAPPEVTKAYQAYKDQRERLFPGLTAALNILYSIPEGVARDTYLARHPEIDEANRWKNTYLAQHPEIIPYAISDDNKVAGASPQVQALFYQFQALRESLFPGIMEVQNGYFQVPEGAPRQAYRAQNPQLEAFWEWRREFMRQFPDTIPYIMSTESLYQAVFDEPMPAPEIPAVPQASILEQIDPMLMTQLEAFVYTDRALGSGARAALARIWENQGKPGKFEEWLEAEVVPMVGSY